MNDYIPSGAFDIPIKLLIPVKTNVKGTVKKSFPDDGPLIFCSFKTYGGTESNSNGVYSITDTANVETWYRPDIKSDCRIKLCDTGSIYDIINDPENINRRNQYMKFKVQRVIGGV